MNSSNSAANKATKPPIKRVRLMIQVVIEPIQSITKAEDSSRGAYESVGTKTDHNHMTTQNERIKDDYLVV